MTLYSNFKTPHDASRAVKDAAGRNNIKIIGRPYNFHDPERSNWWLYNDTDWPAYRFAKLFFEHDEMAPGTLLCGLYVEKGLGNEAAAVHQKKHEKRWFVQPDWAWHRVIAEISEGRIQPVLDELSKSVGPSLVLVMRCSYDIDFSEDPHKKDHDKDGVYKCRFEYKPDTGSLVFRGTARPPNNPDTVRLADIMNGVRSLNDFGEAPGKFPKKDWIWVDVYIGVDFTLAENTPQDADTVWDGDAIWDKWLKLFLPWLK